MKIRVPSRAQSILSPARSALVLAALAAALLVPAASAAPAGGSAHGAKPAAKPDFTAFASCANGKPFKAAKDCRYDRDQYFRATFVLQSHVGKRPVKACFRIYGPQPLGGGHACAKLGPIAYKAYPFKITGVREHFSVKVTWYANTGKGGLERVAASSLRVKP